MRIHTQDFYMLHVNIKIAEQHVKTSEYLFQKGLDFFHIIARYKSNIIIFICSEQGEQHLGHSQKHIFGESRGSMGVQTIER